MATEEHPLAHCLLHLYAFVVSTSSLSPSLVICRLNSKKAKVSLIRMGNKQISHAHGEHW